jgi:hypothetical protein
MPRQHTMLRLLLLHATAAAFPMLGAEISLGERTKMSWDPPQNGDDGVEHFQLFLPRRWSKDQRWPMLIFLHGAGDGVWASAYIKLSRRVYATAESWSSRHRRDASSTAWRCGSLTTRFSQHGRLTG